MTLAMASVATSPPASAAPPARSADQVVIVNLADASDVPAVAADARAHSLTVRKSIPKIRAVSLRVPASRLDDVVARYRTKAGVTSVEIAAPRRLGLTPDDPGWDHEVDYLDAVTAPTAWDIQQGSPAVKIAVVDSGVDVTHPDLAAKVVGQYNAADGSTDVTDELGHGTFVAGVAAAVTNNALGVAGAGYDSSLLAVKVDDGYGDIPLDYAMAGVIWAADHGARVINCSYGGAEPSVAEQNAIAYAQSLGAVVVASAGNYGHLSNPVVYPAAYPGVIAVGATDGTSRAYFSEYGEWLSVAAPGVGIFSTTPLAGSTYFHGWYAHGSGTSFSAPIVSGEVALLAAQSPSASADELRAAVVATAHGYAGLGLGTGQVDFAAALASLSLTTIPTITSPILGATVSGVVPVTATSTAPMVQFAIDAAPLGEPVTVVDGVASTTWVSYDAVNGPHTLSAVDCILASLCGASGDSVAVTLANTGPTITRPITAETVAGEVTLSATSLAPAVRFAIDGVPLGAPVAVDVGVATTIWSSYGTANGLHTVTAVECADDVCAETGDGVVFTLANEAPVVTSPVAGQSVSGAVTLSATAPGGGIAFLVDGVRRAFDPTAPYSVPYDTSALSDGAHVVVAVSCSVSGSLCDGPMSVEVAFTTTSLNPTMVSIAPNPFSPNGDARLDRTTATFSLPDAATVNIRVLNSAGVVVRGPTPLGTLAAGEHSWTWNGRNNAFVRVRDGVYTIKVSTSVLVGEATLRGSATATVRVDTVAPYLSYVWGSGSTFYPYPDGYRDAFSPSVRVNEAGTLTLDVYSYYGASVRSISADVVPGRASITWDGRNSSGYLVGTGYYRWRFTITDAAGNHRHSCYYYVKVR